LFILSAEIAIIFLLSSDSIGKFIIIPQSTYNSSLIFLGIKIHGKLILALIVSTISHLVNILELLVSKFVAIIFKGILVSSILIFQKISLNFFSTLFHFKSPVLKSKSHIDK
jgi:hypothetical protein